MGILEQVQSGSKFIRGSTSITNTPVSGSTTSFGSMYILLNVTVNNPCRIRLYSDSASVAIDDARPSASFDISESVGLILDTLITSQSYTLNFDPPMIGTTFSGNETWYNISGSGVTATFTYYPIESELASRQSLDFQFTSIPAGFSELGNLTSPKSFVILSASCNYSESRLRLYSKNIDDISSGEKNRTYSTTPDNQDNLIADMLFDSASYGYKLTPVLQAFNLNQYSAGQNSVGYIFQNSSSAATFTDVTASLYIYSVED